MFNRAGFVFHTTLTYVFIASFWITACLSSSAQSSLRPETQTMLAQKVHLSLGSTLLPVALKALSAQTGLTIEAVPYLQERMLLLEIDGLSTSATLDGIVEMNDWNWHETTPGHILISRSLPRYPQDLTQLSKYVVAALPKDIRDLLYIAKTPEELKHAMLPIDVRFPPNSMLKQTMVPATATKGSSLKLQELKYRSAETFASLLEPKPEAKKFYAYSQLKLDAQKQLLMYMTLYTLKESSSSIFYNNFAPYQLDMSKAVIEFNGNMMTIGSHTVEGDRRYFHSFGAQVPHFPEAPSAKP